MSHTQHNVAYARQKCHMQEDVAFAAYMCCICYKMFGMLVTCTVLATYLVICLKTTWLSKSSILNWLKMGNWDPMSTILSLSLQSYYQNKKLDMVHESIFSFFSEVKDFKHLNKYTFFSKGPVYKRHEPEICQNLRTK